ncbi:MAG TPA: hypothetical protein VJ987_03645 [Anaerolineales bacterium]|nr:hypothetical protein [Anaerolineales bacterium]
MPPKRPFGVTLLLWMVLILTAWGVTRFVAALQAWDVLNEFEASLSPLYLSITGAGWGVAGGVLLSSIWRGKPWARFASVTSILIWLIEYWLERIFFQPPRANLPFALSSSIFIIVMLWIISILPGTKSFFTKSEEHEQSIENSNSE